MDALENIMTRRSVRYYTDQPISDEDLETILRAGMAGPSCTNARDWSFLVTRDREILNKMADGNGRPAEPLRRAALGIGSVWLGTYPQMERVEQQRALFGLPDTVIPHSIIAFGYPDYAEEQKPHEPPKPEGKPPKDMPKMPPRPPMMEKGAFEPSRIHTDRW